jgi:hypothetical protein
VDVVEVDAFLKAVKPLLKKAARVRLRALELTAFFRKGNPAKGRPGLIRSKAGGIVTFVASSPRGDDRSNER